ncbi:uncharacterized protein JCM10292_004705 [Rhodotorula paludigena]|uniref:uncharacterized protein n=1 Tax=Rhodotorula paludigena TaxID=86838 RepID=UPI003180055F
MRRSLVLLAAVAALPVLAVMRVHPRASKTYLPPSLDDFYRRADGFESAANGEILKSRSVQYKTTAATGEPDTTIATLFKPLVPADPPRILLLMPLPDSACIDCTVSYAYVPHRDPLNASLTRLSIANNPTTVHDLLAGLAKGWYVAVPDHGGSKAGWLAGVNEAFAGLDGLRAMLNHRATLPSSDGYQAVLRGYSGGAHAAARASQYLESLEAFSGGAFSSLPTAALGGLANVYPELATWLNASLNDKGHAALRQARSECYIFEVGLEVASFFTNGCAAFDEDVPRRYFPSEDLGVPRTAPTGDATDGVIRIPTLMYHSSSDELVPFAHVERYFASQCARGGNGQLVSTAASEHVTALLIFLGDALVFLENAFEGRLGNEGQGCSRRDSLVAPLFSQVYIDAVGGQAWEQIRGLNLTDVTDYPSA